MVKIEAIVRPDVLENIKEELAKFGIKGMTVSQVMGCGMQNGRTKVYRGTEYSINLLPKIKIEIVIADKFINDVVDILTKTARTGEIGDGKIFIYRIEDAVRIRTGEKGEDAI